MHRVFRRGWDAPSENPVQILRSAGYKRHPGRLFFGYFLLATQKKVSRLSVREPTSKSSRRASDTNKNQRLAALPARRMNVKNREQGVPLKPDVNLETSA